MTQEQFEQRLDSARVRIVRSERKAAAANTALAAMRQENARLRLENKVQHGWLNAEDSYTRRYKALEARVGIIRDVLAENFPEKYGAPGAYNWFGTRP